MSIWLLIVAALVVWSVLSAALGLWVGKLLRQRRRGGYISWPLEHATGEIVPVSDFTLTSSASSGDQAA